MVAKPGRGERVRLLGVVRRKRSALLVSTALQATTLMVLSLPAAAQPAPNARPTGGAVVAGAAAISQSSGNTTINQASQRAAVNWQSFDVGSKQSVTFNQPSSSAMTLNRVVGPNPSQIAGRIDANGQVVLVNQSGVTFYKGAQVNTNGLIVTAAGITNRNFMNGVMTFDQPGNPNARIENQGTITIKEAGLAALVAPQVANSGVINAKLGHVVLAGAKTAMLDLYGDGLLSLDVSNQVTQAPLGPDGKPVTALVTNTGVIVADGGTVQLTARAADGIVQTLVQAGGKIRAASMGDQVGTVALNGVGGSIVVEGQLSAPGAAPGTMGGNIEVATTGNVVVASTAKLNASGQAGGGTVAIGTTLARAKGGPSVTPAVTAANTVIMPGAKVRADATAVGNGGRVVVLSGDTTIMSGTVTARGGPHGGNGGFVEVSGTYLDMTGAVDLSAANGTSGTLLLDPDFLTIIAGTGSDDPGFNGTVLFSDNAGGSDTLSSSVLNSFAGNVVLQAGKTLTVASSFSLTSGSSPQSLTLEAGGTLTINLGVNVTASGDVILATGGAGPATPAPPPAQSSPLISLLGSVASTGGSVSLLSGAGGTINVGSAGSIAAASGKLITLQTDVLTVASGAGSISAPNGTVEIAPASGLEVHLAGTTGLTIAQAALSAISADRLRIGAATVNGTLTTSTSAISFDGPISLANVAPTLELDALGPLAETAQGGLSNVGTLTGQTGVVALTGTLNANIGNIGSYTVLGSRFRPGAGDFALDVAGSTAVSGPLTAANVTIDESGASTMNVGGLIAASGTVSLTAGAIALGTAADVQGTAITLTGGSVAMAGTAVLGKAGQTGVVDVSTSAGGVTEASTATINAPILRSTGGVAGDVSLPGTNAVDSLGNFTVTGSFALRDTAALRVTGTVSAPSGNIFLEDSNVGGITVADGAIVAASPTGLVSFQSGVLTINPAITFAAGTVSGGTFELGPDIPGSTMTLGAGGALTSLAGISAKAIRLGAVTQPADNKATITAGVVTLSSAFDILNLPLELDATGAISNASAPLLNVGTLTGNAGSVALTNGTNTIANLGNFTTGGDFALVDSTALTVIGAVVAGTPAAPNIGNTATLSLTAGGSLQIGGAGAVGSLNAGKVTLSAAGPITEANGSIAANDLAAVVTGTGSITLDNPSNQIAASSGLVASNGDVVLVDDPTLVLSGAHSGNNLLFEVVLPGGSIQLSGATLTAAAGRRIGLVADGISETGTNAITAAGGTLELSPFSAEAVSVLGAGGANVLLIDAGLIGSISGGTNELSLLRIGGFTDAGGTLSTAAASVSLDAALDLSTTAGRLDLLAQGAISEPGGPLTVADLTASGSSVTLANAGNVIAASAGITAGAGDVVLVDSANLLLAGTHSANNLFYEVALAGGTLAVGRVRLPATLTAATGGRISLVADDITENAASTIAAPAGTLQVAPFSAINVSLGGTSAAGQLLIDSALLSIVQPGLGTLVAGGFTNIPAGASVVAASGSGLTVDGAVSLTGTASALSLLAKGAVTEPGGPLSVGTLIGAAGGDFVLGNTANAIAASTGITAANGNVVLADASDLTLSGAFGGKDLFFEVARAGGSLAVGGASPATLTPTGRVSLVADTLTANTTGAIGAPGGTVELSPFSAIPVSLAGTAVSGQMLISPALLSDIDVGGGVLLVGGFTNLPAGATTPTIVASTISLDGAVDLTGRAATLSLQAAGAITEPGGPLTVANLTAAVGGTGDISLPSAKNQIAASSGLTAANGNVLLVDDPTLVLSGTHSGTNLLYEVVLPGGSIQLSGAALTAAAGGRIGLVADGLSETGTNAITATGGTLELSPFSAEAVSVLGSGGANTLLIDAGLIGSINGGTNALSLLRIGGFTGSGGPTTAAASVSLDGALNLGTTAATLDLRANGAISEPGGPLTVANLTASGSSITLSNSGNAIAASPGLTATGGDVVLVDAANLALSGTHSGNNLFYEVDTPGGVLAIGGRSTATLTVATGGRISLIADAMLPDSESAIEAPAGVLEVAPFSAINVSLGGTSAAGQLLIDSTLLSIIQPGLGTLVAGGFTNIPAGGSLAAASGSSLTIDGAVSLSGVASTLSLLANGPISEPGGPLSVGTVTGATSGAGGDFVLGNAGNVIAASTGISATNGSVALVDSSDLTLSGAYSGKDLFFEVARAGGSLAVGGATPATLAPTGRVSLVADTLTASTTGAIGVPGGTVELSPFSAIPVSLAGTATAGQMLISAALLSDIDVGSGTLLVGGFTNLPAGTTTPTIAASGINVDGAVDLTGHAATLALQATGPIGEPGGPLTVANLTAAVSATGDVSLLNVNNQIAASSGLTAANGNVLLVDDPTLVLSGVHSGTNLLYEVVLPGGSIQLSGATLSVTPGGRIGLVADGISEIGANAIIAAGGTLELSPFSPEAVSVLGSGGPNVLLIDAGLIGSISGGASELATLRIGGFTGGSGLATAAAGVSLDGALNLGTTAATLDLLANGAIGEPGGPVTVANLTASGTSVTLPNAGNAILGSSGITAGAGDVVLVDASNLTLTGAHSGSNLFYEVDTAGGTITLGGRGAATLTAATGGRISLVADAITGLPKSNVFAPHGTIELAPFSTIVSNVAGTAVPGQQLIAPGLLSEITTIDGTLVIGAYTNVLTGATTRTTSASGIAVAGPLDLAPIAATLDLETKGAATQAAPLLNVGTLIGQAGSAILTNVTNSVGTLGPFTTGTGFALQDSTDLAVAGAVTAGNAATLALTVNGNLVIGPTGTPASLSAGTVSLGASGAITEPAGSISASTLTGSAVSGSVQLDAAGNQIANLGSFSATGGFTLVDGRSLAITGAVTAGTVSLATSGDIVEDAGSLTAASLSATAGGLVRLNGASQQANAIATLGAVTAPGGLTLQDGIALVTAGAINAGPGATITDSGSLTIGSSLTASTVTLSAASIAIPGRVSAASSVDLAAAGAISGDGSVVTPLLTGTASGQFALTGANQVSALGGIAVTSPNGGGAGSFVLNDQTNLVIGSTVNAQRISIDVGASQLTLADGATILTGGIIRPSGQSIPLSEQPPQIDGAFFSAGNFVQLGSSTIANPNGGPSTLRISVSGSMQFDPPLGLLANGTWLILNLTNGHANGDVFVKALDVTYTAAGGANLNGTINGINGLAAAGIGFINPTINGRYTFNGCPIETTACVITPFNPFQMLPPLSMLQAIVAGAIVNPKDEDNILQLPVVSGQDY